MFSKLGWFLLVCVVAQEERELQARRSRVRPKVGARYTPRKPTPVRDQPNPRTPKPEPKPVDNTRPRPKPVDNTRPRTKPVDNTQPQPKPVDNTQTQPKPVDNTQTRPPKPVERDVPTNEDRAKMEEKRKKMEEERKRLEEREREKRRQERERLEEHKPEERDRMEEREREKREEMEERRQKERENMEGRGRDEGFDESEDNAPHILPRKPHECITDRAPPDTCHFDMAKMVPHATWHSCKCKNFIYNGEFCKVRCERGFFPRNITKCVNGKLVELSSCEAPVTCAREPGSCAFDLTSIPQAVDLSCKCRNLLRNNETCKVRCAAGFVSRNVTRCVNGELVEKSSCVKLDRPGENTCDKKPGSCAFDFSTIPHATDHKCKCRNVINSGDFCKIQCERGFYPRNATKCVKGQIVEKSSCVKLDTPDENTCEKERGSCVFDFSTIPHATDHKCKCNNVIHDGDFCKIRCEDGYYPRNVTRCINGKLNSTSSCVKKIEPRNETCVSTTGACRFDLSSIPHATAHSCRCKDLVHDGDFCKIRCERGFVARNVTKCVNGSLVETSFCAEDDGSVIRPPRPKPRPPPRPTPVEDKPVCEAEGCELNVSSHPDFVAHSCKCQNLVNHDERCKVRCKPGLYPKGYLSCRNGELQIPTCAIKPKDRKPIKIVNGSIELEVAQLDISQLNNKRFRNTIKTSISKALEQKDIAVEADNINITDLSLLDTAEGGRRLTGEAMLNIEYSIMEVDEDDAYVLTEVMNDEDDLVDFGESFANSMQDENSDMEVVSVMVYEPSESVFWTLLDDGEGGGSDIALIMCLALGIYILLTFIAGGYIYFRQRVHPVVREVDVSPVKIAVGQVIASEKTIPVNTAANENENNEIPYAIPYAATPMAPSPGNAGCVGRAVQPVERLEVPMKMSHKRASNGQRMK